jgi:vacuolar-type H+-ATPase subunit H
MQHKKNQMSMGLMVQRCHRWRQKRKQYIDQARTTPDEIERERFLQMAEHYGRIVSDEQSKIDTKRDNGNGGKPSEAPDPSDDSLDDDFQDFKNS